MPDGAGGGGRDETVAVLGNGGWGTALALIARRNGAAVRIWGIEADYVAETARTRRNPRYLPGVEIPADVLLTADPADAARDATLLVSAVPTQFLRATFARLAPSMPAGVPIVSVSKGLENGTLERPTQILSEMLPGRSVATLSGPTHAEEVARGLPSTAVVAASDTALAARVQRVFSCDCLRLYASDDVVGVELAAAVKNVIAIAAGVCDGLGLGDNAKAALITRGNAEMTRLGRAFGAKPETFAGLAGIGDLITTCTSRHGRNRAVGERLGRGETIQDILASMVQVAEGVRTADSVVALARKLGVEMPISEQVRRMLFDGQQPRTALAELMGRPLRSEH
ncbi:MAG: NAD(P)-dependent glycerol-3-phosphate dehydrogenase [Planctomycetes bacterium]|nr:NAD(P)-dependent glycerol-3-phosphate dehydrogenase [Planctomycetota bacterium]